MRLVVIAIRDIAKGEEITVDYSLTDWGENAMVGQIYIFIVTKAIYVYKYMLHNLYAATATF